MHGEPRINNEKTVTISERAYERLAKARKEGETLTDVIMRLTSTKLAGLQKRGAKEILTSDNRKLIVRIDQNLCLGAESCVTTAPMVFALDESNLGFTRRDAEPLGMLDVVEKSVDSETIILAAKSCPYRAIYVKDKETGDEIFP